MPIVRRDKASGALIFDLTSEEIELKTLKEEVESLKQTVSTIVSEKTSVSKEE